MSTNMPTTADKVGAAATVAISNIPVVAASGIGAVAGPVVGLHKAAYQAAQGDHNSAAKSVLTGAVGLQGAGLGAAVGSIVPGIGTAIGAVVGGAIGSAAGWGVGAAIAPEKEGRFKENK